MTTRRKTGERRKVQQPFSIDKLPLPIQERIMFLYGTKGASFQAMEEMSAEPVGRDHLGFVEWDKLEPEVLALFPQRRIPKSNLQRYIDVRFRQAQDDVRARSVWAREIAEGFKGSSVKGDGEAVTNAIRDQLMSLAAEDRSAAGRARVSKIMLGLAEIMQQARANDIKERKVAADERKLKLLEKREQLAIRKLEAETARLAKKAKNGQPITQEELNSIRMKAFGF